VAQAADVTFVMVTDTNALNAVADGADGLLAGLGPGKTIVDMSTVSPAASRALAAQVHGRGAEMLDCPVSGSVSTLEAGKATLMVGGDKATYDRVHPLLLDIGPKATYVGPAGAAVSMKIALNLSIGVQLLAFSESILLAEKSGIDRKTAIEVYLNSVLASGMLQYRGPFAMGLPKEAWFDVNMMQKDTTYALEMGKALGVALPTGAVANQFLTAARGLGLEKEDCAVLFHVLARLSGVPA
jgi:3-hydroxyisobutyrate dehydrogenase-like beta-hydroxyacid dehydrogenase